MTAVRKVLVVGAGTAGTALAILLCRAGIRVKIVEKRREWNTRGSGIALQGPALRVLRLLGVYDEVAAHGCAFDGLGLCRADGTLIVSVPTPRTGGPDLPATLGTGRPLFADVLTRTALAGGAVGRLGTTVEALTELRDGIGACFSDGTRATYDLVVGADGIHSQVRELIGVTERPQSVGIGIWRVHARRPRGLDRSELYYDGPAYLAGYTPTGPDTLYAHLSEEARDPVPPGSPRMVEEMRALAASYGGFWEEIRKDITDSARINYTVIESVLVDGQWNRGRVVLIGDAAHACPPSLALGAAMGLEDAAVLAELLTRRERLDQSLFDDFMDRRYERVRLVVDSSLQLAHWQRIRAQDPDVGGLMDKVNQVVGRPC